MQEQQAGGGFDFDAWAELARTDPDAFEKARNNAIEALIEDASPRSREQLRRVQWKLDCIRDTAPTPMAACLRMQTLMWESVLGDDGLLARLRQAPASRKQIRKTARILDFRP